MVNSESTTDILFQVTRSWRASRVECRKIGHQAIHRFYNPKTCHVDSHKTQGSFNQRKDHKRKIITPNGIKSSE